MDPQSDQAQNINPVPFYFNWLFYVLITLLLALCYFVYFWIISSLSNQLVLEVQKEGSSANIYIKKIIAPTNGFLVVQKDEAGLPGNLVEVSPYLIKGTYTDFNIPIINDGTYSPEFYSQFMNQKIYVTFYKDLTNDILYDVFTDTEIPTDIFGKKLRVVFENGVVQ